MRAHPTRPAGSSFHRVCIAWRCLRLPRSLVLCDSQHLLSAIRQFPLPNPRPRHRPRITGTRPSSKGKQITHRRETDAAGIGKAATLSHDQHFTDAPPLTWHRRRATVTAPLTILSSFTRHLDPTHPHSIFVNFRATVSAARLTLQPSLIRHHRRRTSLTPSSTFAPPHPPLLVQVHKLTPRDSSHYLRSQLTPQHQTTSIFILTTSNINVLPANLMRLTTRQNQSK